MLATVCMMSAAVALDWLLGEPRRWHPLVGFGRVAHRVEAALWRPSRMSGAFAVAMLLMPAMLFRPALAQLSPAWRHVVDVGALYFALGHRSLHDHLRAVVNALCAGDADAARQAVSRVVSRDADTLRIAAAACESALENGNDAVFGALFWFACAGGTGALVYRLSNTLDAMWGYRSDRYLRFGWAAARLDDVLNWVPARLTALSYALLGDTARALRCWARQAPRWDSPNAGPVMAAGAGALRLRLGGPARYDGVAHRRAALGLGLRPGAADIERALALVRHGVALWLGVGAAAALMLCAWGVR
jgi:adenosylcobinamide-phosphate synthase